MIIWNDEQSNVFLHFNKAVPNLYVKLYACEFIQYDKYPVWTELWISVYVKMQNTDAYMAIGKHWKDNRIHILNPFKKGANLCKIL